MVLKMYPFKMKPLYKEILWGGDTLKKLYDRRLPFIKTAESWEVAAHKNGCSEVINGAFAGETLSEMFLKEKEKLTGSLNRDETVFPLLFKLIDARDYLSVQVHPNDEQAKKDGDLGKTEMWIVLHAEKGSGLYIGFNRDITKEEYEKHIKDNTLKDVLNFIEVRAGDVFFIKAGTIHAIGAGLLIAEIQQNSDTTYRVYDWGRVNADGKPRELHIEKAVKVSDTSKFQDKKREITVKDGENILTYYPCCRYFGAVKADVTGEQSFNTGNRSFHILFCSSGKGDILWDGEKVSIKAGETFVCPAFLSEYKIAGKLTVFIFFVPDFNEDYKKPLQKENDEDKINELYI